jgi:hypothetical protein
MTTERVHFRVVNMRCCHIILCLVNARFYNYCPECGKHCYPQIKTWVECDYPEAIIRYKA